MEDIIEVAFIFLHNFVGELFLSFLKLLYKMEVS